jgi:heavy metal sensor kinase
VRLPIRARLTAIYGLSSAIVVAALGVFVFLMVRADLTKSVDLGLRARAQVIMNNVARSNVDIVPTKGELIDNDEAFSQVLDTSGGVVTGAGSNVEIPPLLSASTLATIDEPTFSSIRVPQIDTDPIRILAVPDSIGGHRVTVVVGATLGDRADALNGLVRAFLIGGPIAVGVTCVAAWLVAGAGLRPVERLRADAATISASDLDRRLAVPPTGDEIARLARTLNDLLARLDDAVAAQLRFVNEASHELRTPLAVLKMELDLALARPRDAEALRTALSAAAAETDRLVQLAEDLLVLARHRDGKLPLRRQPVDMAELVATVAHSHRSRADRDGVRIDVQAEPVTASVDPGRIRQALDNLLDNALHATPPGGDVRVTLARRRDSMTLEIDDDGPGFSPDYLDRPFEPFRHARDGDDGAGLGLAIVDAVVTAHRGVIEIGNNASGGAHIAITLPSAPQRPATSPVHAADGGSAVE